MKLTKEQLLALLKCNAEFVSTRELSEKVSNCERIGTGNFSMCYKILEILICKAVILVILFFLFLMLSTI